jgi:hypothetical protein
VVQESFSFVNARTERWMALLIGDEGEEFRFCKRLRESNPREPVCFARKRACPLCFEERAGWMLASCEAKESGMKIGELCAPSLLKANFSSGRIAIEIQRERLLMASGSDDDRARRLDKLRQEVRMRRFASSSCVDKISIVI